MLLRVRREGLLELRGWEVAVLQRLEVREDPKTGKSAQLKLVERDVQKRGLRVAGVSGRPGEASS